MKKLLSIILVGLVWFSSSIAEEKDNSHLENKFESYLPCDEHVAVLFKKIKKVVQETILIYSLKIN